MINLNINASQSKIDLFCEKLCNIFIENATNVGACKVNKNTNKKIMVRKVRKQIFPNRGLTKNVSSVGKNIIELRNS